MKRSSDSKSFNSSSFFSKSSIIFLIFLISMCLLVPIWQSATNSQLRKSLSESESLLKENEETKMILTASIASKMTPEYLIEQSNERNIVFRQIGGENSTSAVASSNVQTER